MAVSAWNATGSGATIIDLNGTNSPDSNEQPKLLVIADPDTFHSCDKEGEEGGGGAYFDVVVAEGYGKSLEVKSKGREEGLTEDHAGGSNLDLGLGKGMTRKVILEGLDLDNVSLTNSLSPMRNTCIFCVDQYH